MIRLALALALVAANGAPIAGPPISPAAARALQAQCVSPKLNVPLADGGVEDLPMPVHAGQCVAVDAVAMTLAENARRVAERANDRKQVEQLRLDVESARPVLPAWAWLIISVSTAAASVYTTIKLKK